ADEQIGDDVNQQERQESEGHAEVDPLDLLLSDRGSRSIRVRQGHYSEGQVDREMRNLPALNDVEGSERRRDGHEVVEDQQIDVLEDLLREIDVPCPRVDVGDVREQRDKEEERAFLPSAAEQREETDSQIENPDEAEDQIRVVDLQFWHPIGQPEHLISPG